MHHSRYVTWRQRQENYNKPPKTSRHPNVLFVVSCLTVVWGQFPQRVVVFIRTDWSDGRWLSDTESALIKWMDWTLAMATINIYHDDNTRNIDTGIIIIAITIISERELSSSSSLYAIAIPSVVCHLSVTLVHPTQPVEIFGNFSSPYDSPGTLVFWCQNSLVGTSLSPEICVQNGPPLSNSEISTNIGS